MWAIYVVFTVLVVVALAQAQQDSQLHQACRSNDLPEVESLLADNDYKLQHLNEKGSGGQSPLMAAVLSGSNEVVAHLLAAGADPTVSEENGYTPMHGAGFQGRAKIAKMLIEHGLDPSDRHADGFTPIHRAAWGTEKRHRDTIKVFLEHGVPLSEPSRDGATIEQLTKNQYTKQLIKKWKAKQSEL